MLLNNVCLPKCYSNNNNKCKYNKIINKYNTYSASSTESVLARKTQLSNIVVITT